MDITASGFGQSKVDTLVVGLLDLGTAKGLDMLK